MHDAIVWLGGTMSGVLLCIGVGIAMDDLKRRVVGPMPASNIKKVARKPQGLPPSVSVPED